MYSARSESSVLYAPPLSLVARTSSSFSSIVGGADCFLPSAPFISCRFERLCRTGFFRPVPTSEDALLGALVFDGGPDKDCRGGLDIAGLLVGGPIEGRLLALSRDLTLESEVLAVAVVGVVVRGVEAAELAEDARGLVGDFVGD